MSERQEETGHLHPITLVTREITSIFVDMGYEVATGPEVETELYNFDALHVPPDHPARDMQDTFFLKNSTDEEGRRVMRTHTSPVQIRYMHALKEAGGEPPFKVVVPGKVFRNEATDATHEAQFYQLEGLVVGEDITLSHLKGALEHFLKKLFGDDVSIKLRPGFFPFVEPGVEVDMLCFRCKGDGCPSCSASGWIEILGAGMVHPSVLSNGKIDPRRYRGFAFGVGLDRVAMLKYGIDDVRLLYSGDLRVVNQF